MTEHRRIPGDPRLGFSADDLAGELCLDCGKPAELSVDDADGTAHYCHDHDPTTRKAPMTEQHLTPRLDWTEAYDGGYSAANGNAEIRDNRYRDRRDRRWGVWIDGDEHGWFDELADAQRYAEAAIDAYYGAEPEPTTTPAGPTCTCGRPLPLELLRDLDITKSHRCECGAVSALIPVPAPAAEPEPDPTATFLGKVDDAWHEATKGELALVADPDNPSYHDAALSRIVVSLAAYARETIDAVGAAQVDRHGNDVATVDNDELAHRIAAALDLVLYGNRT